MLCGSRELDNIPTICEGPVSNDLTSAMQSLCSPLKSVDPGKETSSLSKLGGAPREVRGDSVLTEHGLQGERAERRERRAGLYGHHVASANDDNKPAYQGQRIWLGVMAEGVPAEMWATVQIRKRMCRVCW